MYLLEITTRIQHVLIIHGIKILRRNGFLYDGGPSE